MTTAEIPVHWPSDAECKARLRELNSMVRKAGLREPQHWYYIRKISITLLLFFGGIAALFFIGRSWLNLLVAVYMAIMFTQVAYLGHDFDHFEFTKDEVTAIRLNTLLGNLLTCLSRDWWHGKHGRHHEKPNVLPEDPDVGIGALTFSDEQARNRGLFGQWLAMNQAWLFFPMLALEGFALHVHSIVAQFNGTVTKERRRMELPLLVLHLVAYLTVLFVVLTPLQAVVFIAIHKGLGGMYLGLSFAINHKPCPKSTTADPDRLRLQVNTTMNIRGGWLTHLILGGLNLQAPHHLWPTMPRCNLPEAARITEEFCQGLADVDYTVVSLWRAYVEVIKALHAVGAELRAEGAALRAA